MSAVPTTSEGRELRRLIPLNTLPESRLEQLCSELVIEDAGKGTVLFHQGDTTRDFVYVLSGTVSLQAGGVEMDSISGGSDVSRFALAHQNPRKVSAVAKTPIRYVRINPDLINQREEGPPDTSGYKVSDSSEGNGGDWMSSLLRSPIFQRLPPANLQAILRNIQEVQVKAGDVICRQDDDGDYFYIIKRGQCSLARKPTPTARDIRLATLKTCDTFGEDALISEKPRTVTITMDTDGELLRLDKANFLKLVRDPIITRLTSKEAIAKVNQGGIWLDVRLPDHFQQGHPRGRAINAPFFSLRMMLPTLDRQKDFVVVCEDGKISEAATYLLLRFRFNAYVLKGGIGTLPAEELTAEPATAQLPPATDTKADLAPEEPAPAARPEAKAAEPAHSSAGTEIPQPDKPAEAVPPSGDGAAPIRSPASREQDLRKLESRLTRLMGEKEKSDADLQQARQTVHRLEAALQALQRDHQKLLQAQAEHTGVAEPRSQPSEDKLQVELDKLQIELDELKTHYAEALFEKESAQQEIQSLETQVGDLKAMVEEFLEQGESAFNGEAEALRSELDMVREQAGAELATLQSLLSEAETENFRLRGELQSIRTQLSVRDVAATVAASESPAGRTLAVRIGWGLAGGLIVTALVIGALFGLDPGRELARSWLGDTASTTGAPSR
jgi:CRP-like cAMP-binding protein/predicted  nucleic acid-binding Zn-ribbon protein